MQEVVEQLLKYSDVADQLKVSVRTVTRMVDNGLPIVHLHGRVYRVKQSALDLFIKQHTKAARSPDIPTDWWAGGKYSEMGSAYQNMARERVGKGVQRLSEISNVVLSWQLQVPTITSMPTFAGFQIPFIDS